MLISKLDILLGVKTDGLTKGFRKGNQEVSKFSAGIGGMAAKMAVVGTAVATATAAVYKFGRAVREQFRVVDEIMKTSSKLGLDTRELVGFHHAAEQSGVATRTFDMALQRMTRRLSEAAIGTGEAKAALKELGVNAKQLSAAGPAKALREIADRLVAVQSPADRVRLAFKLFDSEGVAMVNVLAGGSKRLAEFQREAERLGLTFDELQGNQIVAANDAMDRMKKSVDGLARSFAILASPAVEKVALFFEHVALGARFYAQLSQWLTGKAVFGPASRELEQSSYRAASAVKSLREAQESLNEALRKAQEFRGWREYGQWANEVAALQKRIRALKTEMAVGVNVSVPLGKGTDLTSFPRDLAKQIETFGMTPLQSKLQEFLKQSMNADTRAWVQGLAKRLEGMEREREATERLKDARLELQSRSKAIADGLRTPMERYKSTVADIADLWHRSAINTETAARAIAQARGEMERMQAAARPGPVEVGSQAYFAAMDRQRMARPAPPLPFGRPMHGGNRADELVDLLKKMNEKANALPEINKHTKRTADAEANRKVLRM